MIPRSEAFRCAHCAILPATLITGATVLSSSVRGLRTRLAPASPHTWVFLGEAVAVLSAALFAIFFALNLYRAFSALPILDVLGHEMPESGLFKKRVTGFVAMEYCWLILNQTLLVFIAPEGLYGWRANGPVDGRAPKFFEPYLEMLQDEEFMRDLPAIAKLSCLRGGFFFERSSVSSITSDHLQKWGLWTIQHSGRIHVHLTSGRSRELILLGDSDPDSLRDRIVTTLGAGVTSFG